VANAPACRVQGGAIRRFDAVKSLLNNDNNHPLFLESKHDTLIVRQRHEPKYFVRYVVSLPITPCPTQASLGKGLLCDVSENQGFHLLGHGVGCMFVTQDIL